MAKSLIEDRKKDKAAERLREIIRLYPDSKAAAEAKRLLAELDK
jgi:TolA-binding protein